MCVAEDADVEAPPSPPSPPSPPKVEEDAEMSNAAITQWPAQISVPGS